MTSESPSSSALRNYRNDAPQYDFYKEMHKKQTTDFVTCKLKEYEKLNNCRMKIHQALNMMDEFIDPSDPDMDLPNSIHAYQTAERIRKSHPKNYEMQVCGLIHDLGKILFKFGEPSWSVVGDTFVVGCNFAQSIVYYNTLKENPDFDHNIYSTRMGMYSKHCGIENLKIAFGHDEYLYLVLTKNHNHKLGQKYINMIRYHSFYPWHTGGDYKDFMKDSDDELLKNVLEFNKFDLYSKEDTDFVLTKKIKKYYSKLLDKFFPEELQW